MDKLYHTREKKVRKAEIMQFTPNDYSNVYLGTPVADQKPFYIRRIFHLSKEQVQTATFRLSALGVFRAFVNGFRIGDDELAPGYTNSMKTVYYRDYDAREYLKEGENVFGMIVAPGWHCGHVGWLPGDVYGDRPAAFAELLVGDSKPLWNTSNPSGWKMGFGAYELADILLGETVDLQNSPDGWLTTHFRDSHWTAPALVGGPAPIEAPHPPVRVTRFLNPRLASANPDRKIYDLMQNMAGRVGIKVKGDAGATFTLRHAEMLDATGEMYVANLRGAKATDTVTITGNPEGDYYEPAFTFHGFRYVEVRGQVEVIEIIAHSFNTDVQFHGSFQCSDSRLNQLMSNIEWSMRANFIDVPTDCPQRDERLGWTGDAEVFMPTAMYLADVDTFFQKWFQDLEDEQMPNGAIMKVAPYMPLDTANNYQQAEGGPAWADALPICLWHHWRQYADSKTIEKFFPSLDRFAKFLHETSKDGMRCYPGYTGFMGFGDWLTPGPDTSRELLGTAYYAYSTRLTAQLALAIGKPSEAYETWHKDARTAFQSIWANEKNPTQTAILLAIAFELLSEADTKIAGDQLAESVSKNGLLTGFVGTHFLCEILTQIGHSKLAYDVLFHPTWPGWLYPISEGATSMWERWDGWSPTKGFQDPGMNSFNHYAFGAIGQWMFGSMLGIRPEKSPSPRVTIAPHPDQRLQWASGASNGITSSWRFVEDSWHLLIESPVPIQLVPPSGYVLTQVSELDPTVKAVDLGGSVNPNGVSLAPGKYMFSSPIPASVMKV